MISIMFYYLNTFKIIFKYQSLIEGLFIILEKLLKVGLDTDFYFIVIADFSVSLRPFFIAV